MQQRVVGILLASFSANGDERRAAEEEIASLTKVRGSLFALLTVAGTPSIERDARQAAVIALKNAVKREWDSGVLFANDAEKAVARSKLLSALLSEGEATVRDQLAEVVNEVSIRDFPKSWPELVPKLVETLRMQRDAMSVHNALLATRKLCKRFEFKSRDEGARLPLEDIVLKTFELMKGLLARFVPEAAQHPEAATLSKLILKTFWSCTQFALPEAARQQPEYIVQWFDLVKAAMECGAGAPATKDAEEALAASPLWKLKKWAAQIAARFLQRYGRAKYVEDPGKSFAEVFAERCAPQLLESCFGLLAAYSRGCFVSPRVRQLCFTYIDTAVEIGSLYKLMRPHLDFVLFEASLPAMCATYEDLQQFQSDPQEFVRKAHDPMEDFLEPKAAAMNLVAGLVRTRPKDVFEKILGRLSQVLAAYEATPSDRRTFDAVRSKDGALCALGALADELRKKKKYARHVDSILGLHVLPEILDSGVSLEASSSVPASARSTDEANAAGLLRCRACWTLQQFANHASKLSDKCVEQCVRASLTALNDPMLPVRVEAAGAVRQLLAATDHQGIDDLMRPALPQILDACFRIMGEIGSDDVVQALEIVIDKFGDDIAPYAVALARNLAGAFANYASAGEDDDEASMAAAQCVEAMAATLNSISRNNNNIYAEIEPHLIPVLVKIVGSSQGDLVEYFENAIEVLTYFTYSSDSPFSRDLWGLFELLIDAFHAWAYDYIPDLVRPLDNFVSRDTETFLSQRGVDGTRYIDKLAGVAGRLLAPDNFERTCERDAVKATHILLSIVHNCKGRGIDDSVVAYARLVTSAVPVCLGPRPPRSDEDSSKSGSSGQEPWMPSLASSLITVWSSLLWYDAALVLRSAAPSEGFLNAWFHLTSDPSNLTLLSSKLAVLAFANVVKLDAEYAVLKPYALARIVALVDAEDPVASDENAAHLGDDDDDYEVEEFEDDDDEVEGAAFDEDINDPEDEAYLAAITSTNNNGTVRDAIANFAYVADVDDEEEFYQSPVDDENEHTSVLAALEFAQSRGELESLIAEIPQPFRDQAPAIFALVERRAREQLRVDNDQR